MLEVGTRHQDGDCRADQHQRLHGRGQAVGDEQRGEGRALAIRQEQQRRRGQQRDRRRHGDEGGGDLAAQHAVEQQQGRRDREEDLGSRQGPVFEAEDHGIAHGCNEAVRASFSAAL